MARVPRFVSTFSIVGYDPQAGEWGIGVQSKFLAVGAVVPWARAGVGAVATQSFANTAFGPDGLGHMARGLSAQETMERLLAADPHREHRQVGIVDAQGRSATFTGRDCFPWAGGVAGENFAAQGNILVSEATVAALAETFQAARGSLAERLVAALDAAQDAGGDRRGRQSAALLVVKDRGGYGGLNDRYVDLRVDDHAEPIKELGRLLDLYKLYFYKTDPADLVPIDQALARELQDILRVAGYFQGESSGVYDETTKKALLAYIGTENLEERQREGAYIDRVVLEYMRNHRHRLGG
ncbi:MAG: DUF1028 domain-containing protein [Bacillota bacterium]